MHLDVEPFQETLNASMCGPAALKIVLGYYGTDETEESLAKLTSWERDLGASAENIGRAAESLGYKVEIKNNSTFSDIESWLERGVPVIVDWFTRGRDDYVSDINVPDGHYSVVCGLDDTHIYLQDPEIGGIRKLKRDSFERAWFDFSGTLISPDELIVRQLIAIYK
ncbi:MAG: cysteine peptidase family C39 domain-containing protein [bacterium]